MNHHEYVDVFHSNKVYDSKPHVTNIDEGAYMLGKNYSPLI